MTNFIEDARTNLKGLLPGRTVFDHRPEGATPPYVAIEARDPYLQPGTAFKDWRLSVSLTYVGKTATNSQSTKDLDQNVSELIEAVRGVWTVDGVTAGYLDVNESTYASAAINIHTSITAN